MVEQVDDLIKIKPALFSPRDLGLLKEKLRHILMFLRVYFRKH